VLRHLAALAQAAKGKVAVRVGSIAIRGVVCSSLILAGVLYPCRATSQVSLERRANATSSARSSSMVLNVRTQSKFSFKVRMKRSATSFALGFAREGRRSFDAPQRDGRTTALLVKRRNAGSSSDSAALVSHRIVRNGCLAGIRASAST